MIKKEKRVLLENDLYMARTFLTASVKYKNSKNIDELRDALDGARWCIADMCQGLDSFLNEKQTPLEEENAELASQVVKLRKMLLENE